MGHQPAQDGAHGQQSSAFAGQITEPRLPSQVKEGDVVNLVGLDATCTKQMFEHTTLPKQVFDILASRSRCSSMRASRGKCSKTKMADEPGEVSAHLFLRERLFQCLQPSHLYTSLILKSILPQLLFCYPGWRRLTNGKVAIRLQKIMLFIFLPDIAQNLYFNLPKILSLIGNVSLLVLHPIPLAQSSTSPKISSKTFLHLFILKITQTS